MRRFVVERRDTRIIARLSGGYGIYTLHDENYDTNPIRISWLDIEEALKTLVIDEGKRIMQSLARSTNA